MVRVKKEIRDKRSKPKLKSKGGIRRKEKLKKPLDARQKLNMRPIADARDVLVKKAKPQDARGRIQKMRERRRSDRRSSDNLHQIGASIIRKTDINGKITLVTNKHTKAPSSMNLAIQQQLGLLPRSVSRSAAPKRDVVKPSPPVIKHQISPNPTVIRKTIRNNYSEPMPIAHVYTSPSMYAYEDPYRWHRNTPQPAVSRPPPPIEPPRYANDGASNDWMSYSNVVPVAPRSRAPRAPPPPVHDYVDLDSMEEDVPIIRTINRSNAAGIHSRLDGHQMVRPTSHGILAHTKTKVMVPSGHRIVVSNLQPTVTEDDIRELFEDVGELLVAKLVRPGTGEVIFKNLDDAQKAVESYHNRQLDGQPMKCLLVNKRPANKPTAPALRPTGTLNRKTASASLKLIPDVQTIHKVLFQRT